ncbi:MAG: hypothetical protein FD160_1156 [Caulobacteraceae bacterium]|nr:MAG: hypothetical protein FD160_1156 [Caulobacteraceae bacterium]
MTDVFISYKKEDAGRVAPIARALAQAGFEVWWDHNIPPGRSYREVIGAALETARCVIVVWSKLSVEGQWVLDEADAGKRRNVLLPILIDEVEIPYGFRQIEAARLIGWTGDPADHEWTNAVAAVAHFVGRAPGGPPKPFATPSTRPAAAVSATIEKEKSGGAGPLLIGVAFVALLAGGGFYAWNSGLIGRAPITKDAGLSAPDAAVPIDAGAPVATPTVGEVETHDYVEPSSTDPDLIPPSSPATKPSPTTQGLRRATFQSGGAIVREASGAWVEENAQTGALDGARWREESRDADTITLRDDGRRAGMRIELAENAIYLYFPDWGEWKKQWIIGETNYE